MVRKLSRRSAALLVGLAAIAIPLTVSAGGVIQLVPGTAVLLSNTTGSGGGGNGGNTSSASSSTNIFSPASYVDYHEAGGEPTTAVDRYPFGSLCDSPHHSSGSCVGFIEGKFSHAFVSTTSSTRAEGLSIRPTAGR